MDYENSKVKLIEKLIKRENLKKKKLFNRINQQNYNKYKEISKSVTYSFKL